MPVILLYFIITSVFEINTLGSRTAYRVKAPLGRFARLVLANITINVILLSYFCWIS